MRKHKKTNSFFYLFLTKNKLEILLFFIVFILYANTINNGYNLDDEFVTAENTLVQKGIRGLKKIFTTHYTEGSNSKYQYEYRPIVKVSYAFEYSIFGQNPQISHLINLILYAICVILLFRLLNRIFSESSKSFSFLVCLLFAVHPLHTEVVASLKNRDEILAMLFGLLMILTGLNILIHKIQIQWPLFILFFCLSIFSKKDGLLFLILFPVIILYFFKKESKWYLLASLCTLPFFIQKLIKRGLVSKDDYSRIFFVHENPLFNPHDFIDRFKMGASSFIYYLKIFYIPYPLRFFYGYNEIIPAEILSIKFILTVVLLAAMIYLCVLLFKRNKILSFGLLFTLLTLSVYLNIVTPVVGIVAERFAFIPSIGLCIITVSILCFFFNPKNNTQIKNNSNSITPNVKYILFGISLIFSVMTFSRNFDWQSRMKLFKNDIAHLENSAKAHHILGNEHYVLLSKTNDQNEIKNHCDSAILHFKRATEIYPEYLTAHNNLGTIYFNLLNQPQLAIKHFEKVIRLDSTYLQAQVNLSACFLAVHDSSAAIKQIKKALLKDKLENPTCLLMAAKIFQSTYNYDAADNYIALAKSKFPINDLIHIHHANLLMERKDTSAAVSQLSFAIDKKTKNEQVYRFLIGYYAKKNNLGEAERITQLLRKINPNL